MKLTRRQVFAALPGAAVLLKLFPGLAPVPVRRCSKTILTAPMITNEALRMLKENPAWKEPVYLWRLQSMTRADLQRKYNRSASRIVDQITIRKSVPYVYTDDDGNQITIS